MKSMPTLAILCGGQSPEHSISLLSARNVVRAGQTHFHVLVVGITRQGDWRLFSGDDFLVGAEASSGIALNLPGSQSAWLTRKHGAPGLLAEDGVFLPVDVVFPVLHGAFGEDGTVQGLLEMHGIPYVGCGVAASAICMDKDLTKRLLAVAGIPVAPGVSLEAHGWEHCDLKEIIKRLGFPLFVKPARLGSSIGVHRVLRIEDLREALVQAFLFDTKVLLESQVVARELECAVIGNETPNASLAGEIIPRQGFYSYEAKYEEADGAEVAAPAVVSPELHLRVQALACEVYRVLGCAGLARVDFFLTRDERLVVNEVNALPGFTDISLFPRLWAQSGLSLPDLVSRLVELALDRHARMRVRMECLPPGHALLKESLRGHR